MTFRWGESGPTSAARRVGWGRALRAALALIVVTLAAVPQQSIVAEAAGPRQNQTNTVMGNVTAGGSPFTVTASNRIYTAGADVKLVSYPHAGGARAVQTGDRAKLTVSGDTVKSAAILPPWFGRKDWQSVAGKVTAISPTSIAVGATTLALLPQSLVVNRPGYQTIAAGLKVGDGVQINAVKLDGTLTAAQAWLVKQDVPPARRPSAALYMAQNEDLTSLAYTLSASSVCGPLAANTTWNASGSPYLVTCPVAVPAGVTLTIQPGVQVQFAAIPGNGIVVDGTLKANGTYVASIQFLSALAAPADGDWQGVTLSAGATAQLTGVTFRNVVCAVDTLGNDVTLKLTKFDIAAQSGGVCSGGAPLGTISGPIKDGKIVLTGNGSADTVGISGGTLPGVEEVSISALGAGLAATHYGIVAGLQIGALKGVTVTFGPSPAGAVFFGASSGGSIASADNVRVTFTGLGSAATATGLQGNTVGPVKDSRFTWTNISGGTANTGIQGGDSLTSLRTTRFTFAGMPDFPLNTAVLTGGSLGAVSSVNVSASGMPGSPANAGLNIGGSLGSLRGSSFTFSDSGNDSAFLTNTGVLVGANSGAASGNAFRMERIKGFSTNTGLNVLGDSGPLCDNQFSFTQIEGGFNLVQNGGVVINGSVPAAAQACSSTSSNRLVMQSGGGDDGGNHGDDGDCRDNRYDRHTNGGGHGDDDGCDGHQSGGGGSNHDGDDDGDCRDGRFDRHTNGGSHNSGGHDDDDCDDGDDNGGGTGGNPASTCAGATIIPVVRNTFTMDRVTGMPAFNQGLTVFGDLGGASRSRFSYSSGDGLVATLGLSVFGTITGRLSSNQFTFNGHPAGSNLNAILAGAITACVLDNSIQYTNSGAGSIAQAIVGIVRGTASNQVAVQGNRISMDAQGDSIGLDLIADYVTMTGNEIAGGGAPAALSSSGGIGLRIRGAADPVVNTSVTCNTIRGWGAGIQVDNAGATIRNNSLRENLFHIVNSSPTVQNAQRNYWGGAPNPANFAGLVDFSNPLTSTPSCITGGQGGGHDDGDDDDGHVGGHHDSEHHESGNGGGGRSGFNSSTTSGAAAISPC